MMRCGLLVALAAIIEKAKAGRMDGREDGRKDGVDLSWRRDLLKAKVLTKVFIFIVSVFPTATVLEPREEMTGRVASVPAVV